MFVNLEFVAVKTVEPLIVEDDVVKVSSLSMTASRLLTSCPAITKPCVASDCLFL